MRLKLDALQRVVKRTMDEERVLDALREEVKRVLGPTVLTDVRLEEIAESANHKIDCMEQTGNINRLDFKPNVVSRYLDHTDPQVRRFAARVVPEKFLSRMTKDRSNTVRSVVASRASLTVVREMMKNFPSDDQLKTIYTKRTLAEAGIAQPKVVKEPFDMYGEERLGDAAKQAPGPELSEQWYKDKAFKLMQDFGGALEYSWEEQAARQYCRATKATSGVEIDEVKLLKAIKDLIEESEDMALERDAMKETLSYLDAVAERETLNESAMPIVEEREDAVQELMEANLGAEQFMERAKELFAIKGAPIPAAIKKYRLGEGSSTVVEVPIVAMMPASTPAAMCERALDAYCRHWTSNQSLKGEPIVIEWSYNPTGVGKVCFSVSLK